MLEEIQYLSTFLKEYFIGHGMNPEIASFINLLVNILVIIFILFLIHFLTKRAIRTTFKAFTNKTKSTFDDYLLETNFSGFISNILPLLFLEYSVPIIFESYPAFLNIFNVLFDIYIIILMVLICRSLLRSSKNYLKSKDEYKDKPLESFLQVFMIFIWALGFVFIFSEITGEGIFSFLISLGAASAVILLIFKDTILGFVASIQISVNDIVRIGDWITFSKFGADGFVTEINLATVKVQNWDNTYTTIPTYSLIGDSFQNWRGMQDSPGRRIKRSLFIKQKSIKLVSEEDLEKYKKIKLIAPYIEERQKLIDDYNKTRDFDRGISLNGRNQTNLGIFRKYTEAYLHQHPLVSKELWIIVRHLDPTVHGIPLEIYCFSSDKRWAYYEDVAADIFDHLIAAIPYFDLQLFEAPSGDDIVQVSKALHSEKV
ncbi:MAG TPA: mechanosensitive ion channel domain-containing protein [Salinimicrobium sp.]|nr:mechanosensitive ion channel domain-containing protein [Salinimicrobium sp.]